MAKHKASRSYANIISELRERELYFDRAEAEEILAHLRQGQVGYKSFNGYYVYEVVERLEEMLGIDGADA